MMFDHTKCPPHLARVISFVFVLLCYASICLIFAYRRPLNVHTFFDIHPKSAWGSSLDEANVVKEPSSNFTKSTKDLPQPPPQFNDTAASIIDKVGAHLKKSRELHQHLVATISEAEATFESVLLPIAHDENETGLSYHILGFYKTISGDLELRTASQNAVRLIQDFERETATNFQLFTIVEAVINKGQLLDRESQLFLDRVHKSFVVHGQKLSKGHDSETFQRMERRIDDLTTTFTTNLDVIPGLWLTPEELAGVPDDIVSGWKTNLEGLYFLTLKSSDYVPVLQYAKNTNTRRKVFLAYENKVNQNVPIFKEIVLLRDQIARLLGYPSHAALHLEDKMAKNPGTVNEFLQDLRLRLVDGGNKQIADLKLLKSKDVEVHNESEKAHFFLWDYYYYNRVMGETLFQVDQQLISEYFTLEVTISCMLNIFQKLMGLSFVPISEAGFKLFAQDSAGQHVIWQEDVQLFAVWNDASEGDDFVGYLYLDLFPRDGKFGHAANFLIQPGFRQKDGTRRYPVTSLVCNFRQSTVTTPSLLTHDEVVTLFHELGHGIHDLVSKTLYSRFHGTRTVTDSAETPSQMLENWCWVPSQLIFLSRHYSTISPEYYKTWQRSPSHKPNAKPPMDFIPSHLVDNLIRSRHLNSAISILQQLHISIFDMSVHHPASHESLIQTDVSNMYNELRKDIVGMEGPIHHPNEPAWANGEVTFGHLVEGYDAGYYGYLSSKVYSMDIFYMFFKDAPLNSTEGRRYRHSVLEKGGSQDEMLTITEYLGRKPSMDAFYADLGPTV